MVGLMVESGPKGVFSCPDKCTVRLIAAPTLARYGTAHIVGSTESATANIVTKQREEAEAIYRSLISAALRLQPVSTTNSCSKVRKLLFR